MRKKKTAIFLISFFCVTIICIGICFYVFPGFGTMFPRSSVCIYSDISECQLMSDENFVLYDSPSADPNLDDLVYSSSFCGSYISENMQFEIFAYEFIDDENAKSYFSNATGKIDSLDKNFTSSYGLRKYQLVVLEKNKAYTVTSPKKYSKKVESFLLNCFSNKITRR